MNDLIKEFSYEGKQLRTVATESNQVMFCLKDVCNILGLSNVGQVKSRLVEADITNNDVRSIIEIPVNDGVQNRNMIFINEPNLYRCVFQSTKPNATAFQNWVYNEILPSIRKNGGYIVGQEDVQSYEELKFII